MATISQGLWLFPISLSMLLVLAIIISYILSLVEHDVEPFLPSVSKTAAFQPQGSVFAQFLDIIAVFGLINVLLRFLQVEMLTISIQNDHARLIFCLRLASLFFGIATMFGVTVAGNFRFPQNKEHHGLGIVHFTGSLVLGLGAIVYCFLESAITYQLSKHSLSSFALFVTRLLITVILTVSGIIHVLLKVWTSDRLFHDGNALAETPWRPYNSTQDYYPQHVASNLGEWIAFFLLAIFAATFSKEMQQTSISLRCFPKEVEY